MLNQDFTFSEHPAGNFIYVDECSMPRILERFEEKHKPPRPHTMTREEKKEFDEWAKSIFDEEV